jgi:magnesium-dependent phosphatase-1
VAVRLVVLDCDLTLWDHHDATLLLRPFRRVAPDAIEDRSGVRVTLHSGVRELLDGLKSRGLLVACASWNEPRAVDEIFALLDLDRYFDHKKVEPHPEKHRTIAALLGELAQTGVRLVPDEVLYVDDRRIHLDAIHATVGRIRFIQYGTDIRVLTEVLDIVDGAMLPEA